MPPLKRTNEEIMTLSLCGLCMLGLLMFAVIHSVRGDFAIATVNGFGFLGAALIFWNIYSTNNIKGVGPLLSLVLLSGTIAIIYLGGTAERYILFPAAIIPFFLASPAIAFSLSGLAVIAASVIMLPTIDLFEYGKFLISVSGCIVFAYIFSKERNRQRDDLLKLSTKDPLTGIGNRRGFDERLEEIILMQQRTQSNASMMLIDLDNFKLINDSEGHLMGDEVMVMVADIIERRLRAGDNLYRFGGDEFVVLAAADIKTATTIAEGLRELVALAPSGSKNKPTLSIGVTQHLLNETSEQWFRRTDAALFEAKRAGRNQVHLGKTLQIAR